MIPTELLSEEAFRIAAEVPLQETMARVAARGAIHEATAGLDAYLLELDAAANRRNERLRRLGLLDYYFS